ncbi:MAG: PadR family transcriptional regulator [Actinobacteria bacterium]|nr:PadR family transcriptional regulator [Actinomycetota bacterium]
MTRSTEHQGRYGGPGGPDAPSGCRSRRGAGRPRSGPGEDGPARFKFGPHGPHGPHGHGRGPWSRARRGNVRAAILSVLAEEPMHGYQIMQRLEERSGGMWRPSPGSVYPTLQLLEDQGFIKGEEVEGRRVFALTETGRAEATASKEAHGAPWESPEHGAEGPRFKLRKGVFQIGAAVKQVGTTGSSEQVEKTLEILAEARKRIYELLAAGE